MIDIYICTKIINYYYYFMDFINKENDDENKKEFFLDNETDYQKVYKKLHEEKMERTKNKVKKYLSAEEQLIYDTLPYKRGKRMERKTNPNLTKYEYTNIIGTRTEQLERCATPLINVYSYLNPLISTIDIARLEFKLGLLNYNIRRPFPDGTYEEWSIREMIWKEEDS